MKKMSLEALQSRAESVVSNELLGLLVGGVEVNEGECLIGTHGGSTSGSGNSEGSNDNDEPLKKEPKILVNG